MRAGGIPFVDIAGVNGPLVEDFDQAWKSVLTHGRYVGGPEVTAFEEQFAAYCGSRYCVGVANGTQALELILTGLGIGPGDEVIVPANTFVATAAAVCSVGARPRFVDVLPATLLIDPASVDEAIGPRTAAVIAVHLFGQMVDLNSLLPVVRRHGLALIEDAAQAHGARFDGRRAGSVGVAAGFSFYPGKNLGALGDGGAVVSDDDALISRIRRVANHGRTLTDHHRHDTIGQNSRLDTIQAAILIVKLATLDRDNARRTAVMNRYRARLPARFKPVVNHDLAESVHHLAVVQVPDRDAATAALDAADIGWGMHYPIPCHRQPAFAAITGQDLPIAESAAGRLLSLPMSPTLTDDQVDRVCDVLGEVGG